MKLFQWIFIICSVQIVLGSYLGYPRIHFAGHFRADTNTRNNDRCNFRMNKALNPDLNSDWGFNGTNEVQFTDVAVTSVVFSDGTASSDGDGIINRRIIGNLKRPHAKLTDLDVDVQDHSTIYGMNFGITWDSGDSDDVAFYGKWTPNIIAQDMWFRLKCYDSNNHGPELYQGSFAFGAQFTTTITDIDWNNWASSQVLTELKSAVGDGNLVVRGSIFYYTRNYPTYVPFNATLGYIVGVIGAPGLRDTLNVPGQRVMSSTDNTPVGLSFGEGDLCHGISEISQYSPWMFSAPFEVDTSNSQIHLDLSNAVPSTLRNDLRNIGVLRIALLRDNCVQILGDSDIPYDDTDQLPITSGIYDIDIESSLMDDLDDYPLVLGQYLDDSSGTPLCGEFLLKDGQTTHSLNILLRETEYFVRPNGYYVGRLDRMTTPSIPMDLYVTRYGHPVEVSVKMMLTDPATIPHNGVVPSSTTVTSNSDGIASFMFQLQDDVPIPDKRWYGKPQCTNSADPSDELYLPIEGQVYSFIYCVEVDPEICQSGYSLAFLAFSDMNEVQSPNWVDHVGPIMSQFKRLSPIMHTILNMSSYEEMTLPYRVNLMRETLNLDFYDPSYMPTTRDLSPVKRSMILKWLDNPIYGPGEPPEETEKCSVPFAVPRSANVDSDFVVPYRCNERLNFLDHPEDQDATLANIKKPVHATTRSASADIMKKRPLFGLRQRIRAARARSAPKDSPESRFDCNLEDLKTQLQTAIQVEWATLPPYLTSMYSIIDGCNTKIYERIGLVVMQEMLHFTQSANILIALNGLPLIDDPSVVASYPTGLPGDLLPGLVVTLEKLSLEHVHKIFMGIELPQKTHVAGDIDNDLYTIGEFYQEMSDCINILGDDVFDSSTLDKQVQWPYSSEGVGTVYQINDSLAAINAIEAIISEGEGASLVDPTDIDNNTLAHFFKFEEIVCKHAIKYNEEDDTYSYTGKPIPFNSHGVWPMKANLTASDLIPDTNCYTEAKAFHQVYRNLLRKLQDVFNGEPDEIFNAVSIMESLQVHAKKLMWTKFDPSTSEAEDPTNCGPVWDYDWPDQIINTGQN